MSGANEATGLDLAKIYLDAQRASNNSRLASSDWMGYPFPRGNMALGSGFRNLLDIIRSQGRTDPRLFNEQLMSIRRGTEASQGQAAESMAASGMDQSGVGQAIQAAIGQGGENRVASATANEQALSEDRKRKDLMLLLHLIIGPQLQKRGQDLGVSQLESATSAAQAQQQAEMFASLFSAAASFAGKKG